MCIENIVTNYKKSKRGERGAALAIAVITVAILSVIALTALAFSSTEARIAGSDLQRTQTFYATSSAMEKMTNDFSDLFRRKMHPTNADLQLIRNSPPQPLRNEGFSFVQTLGEDTERLNALRALQNLSPTAFPRVNIPDGPYAGLYSTIIPYKLSSTGTMERTQVQIELEREFNNYLVPLFQFGIYSNEDLEFSPGPLTTFNGRVHSNRNIYALRNVKFLNRVSMAGELVRTVTRGGEPNIIEGSDKVWFEVGGINVKSTEGSVLPGNGGAGGPSFSNTDGTRGYHPFSPQGIPNPDWEDVSVKPAEDGKPNQFGGQVLTNSTGASKLETPLELAGNSLAELIKRTLPSDTQVLSTSRYHNKSQIRILIDDESVGSGANNVAGIPSGKGVLLSAFVPSPLDGNVLKIIEDNRTIRGGAVAQITDASGTRTTARTVRRVKNTPDTSAGYYVPPGSNIQGRILIEIVKPDGATVDVTQEILSLGVTVGEPNGIVYLQRPLWAAMVQGSRDRTGNGLDLENLINDSQTVADGEISDPSANFDTDRGFINFRLSDVEEDGGTITREDTPDGFYNQIVPINVYNVREGWVRNTLAKENVYPERGITSVVELNMRNLARWLDGIYDTNLLAGTNAVSQNIEGVEGYVLYISDRRGDRSLPEYLSDGTSYRSTNGTVDNEDIYGPNGTLDAGEDVIDYGWDANRGAASKRGTLQKNTDELPDASSAWSVPATPTFDDRKNRAVNAMGYRTNYFRRSVRLFNGEKLSVTAAAGKLSPTKGITVASENMVYIWGNYNTSGVTRIPSGGSTLNNGGYSGAQIPASIICDAFFPLSKTWFDSLPAMFPEGTSDADNLKGEPYRMADENLSSIAEGTAVRAGIIAGTTISGLTGIPGRTAAGLRRGGGIINYPRFLEIWNVDGTQRAWSYSGSFIPLFRSTQAISQWEQDTSVIYLPPRRNWSFDQTFLDPKRLPPGTPFFQYVQASGFRQVLR